MLIHKGLFTQATRALGEAEEEYVLRKDPELDLTSHLASVGAESRTLNMFEAAEVYTIGQMFEGGVYSRLSAVNGIAWKSVDAVYVCMGRVTMKDIEDELWRSTVLQQRYRVAEDANKMADLQQSLKNEGAPTEPGWYVWRDGWSDDTWNLGHLGGNDQYGITQLRRVVWLTTEELLLMLGDEAPRITEDTTGPFRVLFDMRIAYGT